MVDLQNLKNAINEGTFSDEAKQVMLGIIDSAIAKGSISAEDKQRVLSIMDLEIAQNDTVQKIYEQAAEAFESFADAVDAKVQTASDNLEALDIDNASPVVSQPEQAAQPATSDFQSVAPAVSDSQPIAEVQPAQALQSFPDLTVQPVASVPPVSTETPQVAPMQPFGTNTITPPETPAQ